MDDGSAIRVTRDGLRDHCPDIRKSLESNGYALLEPWDDEVDTLRIVGGLFGPIQSHIRADERGVVGVGGPQQDAEWQAFRAEYHGLGTSEVAPHTDGTFVDGVVREGLGVRRVVPPRYVILQVVRHADDGGANIVVDAQRVLSDMLRTDPAMAQVLMTPGSVTFCRDDQLALEQAVFGFAGYGYFKVRFRGDSKAYVPPWAIPAVQRLHTDWHMNPAYRAAVDVREGQILVVDNTRVLHGREPFSNEDDGQASGRKLRRIWIADEEDSTHLPNLREEIPMSRALATYDPYAMVDNDLAPGAPLDVATGIRLDGDSMEIAAGLLRASFEEKLTPFAR